MNNVTIICDFIEKNYDPRSGRFVIEITGIPGAGKTTLHKLCVSELERRFSGQIKIDTNPVETWKGISKIISTWLWNQSLFTSKYNYFASLKQASLEKAEREDVSVWEYLNNRLGVKRVHRALNLDFEKKGDGILLTDIGITNQVSLFMYGVDDIRSTAQQLDSILKPHYPDALIWIQCPFDKAIERIKSREKPASHIAKLEEEGIYRLLPVYDRGIAELCEIMNSRYDIPLLIVDNTEDI